MEPEPEEAHQQQPLAMWDKATLSAWLTASGLPAALGAMSVEAGVDGGTAIEMEKADWKELGMTGLQASKIVSAVKKLLEQQRQASPQEDETPRSARWDAVLALPR